MKARFELLEEITRADFAFRAYGNSPEELFFSSVMAVMSIMLEDPASIKAVKKKILEFHGNDIEFLLFEFLQEFVFLKDAESLLLLPQSISIDSECGFILKCEAAGETIDVKRHRFNVDVKAVTMHRFKVEEEDALWTATVVLDV